MKIIKSFFTHTGIFLGALSLFASCSDDSENGDAEQKRYGTTYKMTDAPIDNAEVESVVVTISEVRVDGTTLDGFNKTTFDLSALVNGQTKTLGDLEMAAGSYSNIELVLDYDADMDGNTPGCYVEMADGTKDKIEASSNTITVSDAYEVFATNTNEIIIDFDLRKTVKENEGSLSSDFVFVSTSELSAGIRTVNQEVSGDIKGTVNDSRDTTSDKIVVYAYQKGTYNAEVETKGQGESNVRFANAVTSSRLTGTNNAFSLNFLPAGEYELVFASYTQNGNTLDFNSTLEVESATGLNLGALELSSALQLNLAITVTGSVAQ